MAGDPLERALRTDDLFLHYGALLSPGQRECLELRHGHDLSLAEIAADRRTTRQAVHDLLLRAEDALRAYEEALGLAARERRARGWQAAGLAALDGLAAALDAGDTATARRRAGDVRAALTAMLDEEEASHGV